MTRPAPPERRVVHAGPAFAAVLGTVVLSPLAPGWLAAQVYPPPPPVGTGPLEARIWLDRGIDPVFVPGDRPSVYYRAGTDSHLLILHIDTGGVLRLINTAGESEVALAGRDYELRFPEPEGWEVEASPGVGYFFVLASRDPVTRDRISGGQWGVALGGMPIRTDPYVAVDELRRALLPGVGEDYALDFATYHVGESYSYPRFLCFQCHDAQPAEAWNPYHQTCMDVRVVIFNDPYFYPATRYRGDQVVYARPPDPGLPQFAFTSRIRGEPGTPIVRSRTGEGGPGAPRPLPGDPSVRRVPVQAGGDAGPSGPAGGPRTLVPDGDDGGPEGVPILPGSRQTPDRPILRRRE